MLFNASLQIFSKWQTIAIFGHCYNIYLDTFPKKNCDNMCFGNFLNKFSKGGGRYEQREIDIRTTL